MARIPGGRAGLTVRVTGDRELRRLNREYLGVDEATDVLSFPAGDSAPGARGGGPDEDRYLGDLALSWPAVMRQAAAYGHGEEVEAALLVVHGFLHLLGWDHVTAAEEKEMTELTLRCLAESGIMPAHLRLPSS